MLKHKMVEKDWIKITPVQMRNILQWSGIKFRTIRNGNKYHSTRKTVIPMRGTTKSYWPIVIYSYSSVDPYQGDMERKLERSSIYLNPKYKYLLEEKGD